MKHLSPVESAYLEFLRSGMDTQIQETLNWYDEHEDDLHDLNSSEEFEDEYGKQWLEMILITLMNAMYEKNAYYMQYFYNSGSNLAYNHMNREKVYLSSDEQALNNLTKYTNGVVESINSEFAVGVRNTLHNHIDDGSLDQFRNDLLDLPYTPVITHFSVDNRCVFATKTEYARGVNTGLLQGYSNYGVDTYDWITSGLSNVCKTCKSYEENNPYTLNEIINMMPCHPNCVCSVKANLPKVLYLQTNPRVVDLTPKK